MRLIICWKYFFCLQVDEPITGEGGLINGGVYRQQFLPRGVLTLIRFCWVCAAGLSSLLPLYSHFCGQIIDAIHWHMPISLLLGSTPPPSPEFLVLAMTSIFNFLIINSLKESMRGCLNWHKWHVLVFIKTECWGHNNLLLLTLDCKGKLILYSNLKFTFHSQKPHYYEHWGAQRKYPY